MRRRDRLSQCQRPLCLRFCPAGKLMRRATMLHLPRGPGVFPPCVETSRLRCLLFLSCSQSKSVLIGEDWRPLHKRHIRCILCLACSRVHPKGFLRACYHVDARHTAQLRPSPLILSHFHRVTLRDPEPCSQMQQQCGSCPSIRGDVEIVQSTRTFHYTQTRSNIQYRAPLQYVCGVQHNTECTHTPRPSTTESVRCVGLGRQ